MPMNYFAAMRRLTSLTLGILLLAPMQAFAHQPRDGDIYLSGGQLLLQTQTLRHKFPSPILGGGGVSAEADIDSNGGAELGMFYLHQLYSIQRGGDVITELGKRVYITLGYRHWLTTRFSGALAFFSSYSIGKGRIVHNDFPTNSAPETSAHDMTEYGFDFSLQYEPFVIGPFHGFIDGRYAYSVTSKSGEDSNFYAVFFGLKILLQSREQPPPPLPGN